MGNRCCGIYQLFDESDQFRRGDIEFEHSFSFDPQITEGIERLRRVDVFYKRGDNYGHVFAHIPVNNLKTVASVTVEADGLKIAASSEVLQGAWKLASVKLVKYDRGTFKDLTGQPVSLTTSGKEASATWDFHQLAAAFGYGSADEAKKWLPHDKSAWISVAYEPVGGGEPLSVVKPIQKITALKHVSILTLRFRLIAGSDG